MRFSSEIKLMAILASLFFQGGCRTLERITLHQVSDIAQAGYESFLAEEDLVLARDSVAANVKMIDGLLYKEPNDPVIQLLAAKAFFSYAFGYVEPESAGRASKLYRRGLAAGSGSLGGEGVFLTEGPDTFKETLRKSLPDRKEHWFWSTLNFSSWVNLNKDAIAALQNLPKIEQVGLALLEVDPDYHFGGPDLLLGLYYSAQPAMFGGQPDTARRHFEASLTHSGGRYLIAKVLYARYYAVAVQDGALFDRLLEEILAFDVETFPEQMLINNMAKDRARVLSETRDEYFLEWEAIEGDEDD